MGQRFPVSSWREVTHKTLETIADLDQESFDEIVGSFPRFVAHSGDNFRVPCPLSNGTFVAQTFFLR